MSDLTCDVLVIGAGPGGYVCGIRAGQLGLNVIVVEAEKPGGTCLNVGCIPSKALIHAAEVYHGMTDTHLAGPLGITASKVAIDLAQTMGWKDGIVARLNGGVAALLKKSKARLITGRAEALDGKTWIVHGEAGATRISAKNVVVATGSEPVELPLLPYGGKVISSTGALALSEVPRRLVVVGAGYIGLELGMAYAKLGSKVTVVEAADRILPAYDSDLSKPVAKRLTALGIETLTDARAKGLSPDGEALLVETGPGEAMALPADKVLVAVGRRPRTGGFGLEKLDLAMNGAYLRIDDRCATSMTGVYAIGDVTGEPMLAHRAMAQGETVAEVLAGHARRFDKRGIPAVCFTDPEIITIGLSPDEAAKAGHQVKLGVFPFAANGRAMTRQSEDGFVRIVARADNHLVLGIQAVGGGVSELAAAFGLALEMGATLEDVAGTIHAHPTQGEGFQEAALKALGAALHV